VTSHSEIVTVVDARSPPAPSPRERLLGTKAPSFEVPRRRHHGRGPAFGLRDTLRSRPADKCPTTSQLCGGLVRPDEEAARRGRAPQDATERRVAADWHALHLSLVSSLTLAHQRSKAHQQLNATFDRAQGSMPLLSCMPKSRFSVFTDFACCRFSIATELRRCLWRRRGGAQHDLRRRALVSWLRGRDESSRPSTTRAAAPSPQIPSVELHVDALHQAVVNCILTIVAA